VRRKHRGLDLRLDPLLQAFLASVDQVVTCLGRVVVREPSGGKVFQAGVTFESLCRDLAAFDGASHGCGSLVAVDGVGGWKLDSTGIDKTRAIRQGYVGYQLHVKGRDRMVHVIIVG
jgi:hypothetical protein